MKRSKRHLGLEPLERRELLAGDLRIVELNYNPHAAMPQYGDRDADSDDFEFIEVMNVGDAPLNLRDYEIRGGITFEFSQQFLDPDERLVVTKDLNDFRSRYGQTIRIALGDGGDGGDEGEYKGNLKNSGEAIELRSPAGTVIQIFTYYDKGEWPARADGDGSSLEVLDPLGDHNDPKNWRPSSEFGGSPGVAGEGYLGDVVINEILTHTDLPQIDAIELFNRTNQAIDMTNWYLSDSITGENGGLFRFKIQGPNNVIQANNYLVFDENLLGFSFKGQEADNAILVEANDAGRPLRFVDAVSYSATQNGVSLGRWSNGVGELFPMTDMTFEDPNDGPRFDAAVISEVHYHPDAPPADSLLSEDELEFVEIYNRADFPIDLSHWRLTTAVEFAFPAATTLAAKATILVIGFNPAVNANKTGEFRDIYNIPENVRLLGPYSDPEDDPHQDQLDDDGEKLILERPEDIEQLGLGYVLIDRVIYSDAGPWPTETDGGGRSLTRQLDPLGYGDFAESWQAATPTPGVSGLVGDLDGNGIIDADDIDQMCAAINLGGGNPLFDLNRDETIDEGDFDYLVHDILRTNLGDANLDGKFDSGDLVQIFTAGQYEDGIAHNSGWATGDWTCDREFDTGDLVAAFTEGAYVAGATPASVRTQAAPSVDQVGEQRGEEEVERESTQVSVVESTPLREAKVEDQDALDSVFSEDSNTSHRNTLKANALDDKALEILL